MKPTKKRTIRRRLLAMALSAATAFSLAACGNSSGGETEKKEWVWVPEFVTIEDETVSYYDMQLVGDALCYQSYDYNEETGESTQSISRYSLADGSITKTPLDYAEEKNWNLNRVAFAQDGSMYGVTNVYNEDYTKSETFLCKFGADGKQIFAEDMTDLVADSYTDSIAIDGDGRVYVTGEANIWLFDADGNNRGTVALGSDVNWIRAMGRGKDGKMYICYYGSNGDTALCDIDFDGKKAGNTYENFHSGNNNTLVAGIEKDFLTQDGSRVYEYDLKSQTSTELLSWLDSDINGSNVQGFWGLEDGRILAVTTGYETNENGIALLTKTKASEVPQKETILIGSLFGDSNIQSAAVKFNKSNDKYHISIREYLNYNDYDGDDYQAFMTDGINRMNNDITSNNCPDILDLSGLNIKQLAAKGVFEDLNGYLEKSGKLSREDFLANVLEAYTVDGKLVSIPYSFQIATVAGKGSEVGTEMGWTIDELVAYADAHPDAQLFDNASKEEIMLNLMAYNADYFIDWATGECNFDTDEFKSILNFVNRFPDQEDIKWDEDDMSTPNKIQKGQVLLYQENIYDFNELQMCNEIFQGDVSYIGYPTMDGSAGCMLSAFQAYAITSKAKQKDGAWEFIEAFLTQEENSESGYNRFFGFPTLKSKLEAMAADAVEVKYYTDENGELYYDENGEPIVMNAGSSVSYQDGWTYEYRIPTQEEVDMAMSLMEIAKPVTYSQGDEVLNIINEEAAPFFKGQKTVDEAASVIQSRIKIYVGENK